MKFSELKINEHFTMKLGDYRNVHRKINPVIDSDNGDFVQWNSISFSNEYSRIGDEVEIYKLEETRFEIL